MTTLTRALGPLPLTSALHETIWGGRNLTWIAGKELPEDTRIGESWETDVACTVRSGPLIGRTIGELVAEYGEQLVGERAVEVFGPRFPLLAKFIDAHDWLSVQVHPDDAYARAREDGKLGKTEVWYILHAEPGAQIVYGLSREATREEVRAAIEAQRLEELLCTCDARAGEVIFVPAGTVHAIGAGVALYELQEYSDVTYRLYDYGRLQANGRPRELHVESGLSVMRYGPAQGLVTPLRVADTRSPAHARRVLAANRYFVLEELTVGGRMEGATGRSSCQIVTVLAGACTLYAGDDAVPLALGDTVVIPAALGAYAIVGAQARIVRSYVPMPDDALLELWESAQGATQGATSDAAPR